MSRTTGRTSFCVILAFVTATAIAQNNRSAVSVNGSDANTCTTISPCRSFAAALAVTNAGGQVIAVDSGGYGPFTISKSVSVIGAPGVYAALTAINTVGINVTAGPADNVEIRGINITQPGNGGFGILAMGFGTLTIESCSIKGGEDGIVIVGSATSHATVVDTVVSGPSNDGFDIESPAILVRCRAERAQNNGLIVLAQALLPAVVSAVDFVSMSNGNHGIAVSTFNQASVSLDHALIFNNANDGILSGSTAGGLATVRVTNSTVTDNGGYGFHQGGTAIFASTNNNLVAGNVLGDTFGTITVIQAH